MGWDRMYTESHASSLLLLILWQTQTRETERLRMIAEQKIWSPTEI